MGAHASRRNPILGSAATSAISGRPDAASVQTSASADAGRPKPENAHGAPPGSRVFSGRTTRRAALGAALAGLGLGGLDRLTLAQDATPDAATRDWAPVAALIAEAEASGGVMGVAVHGAEGELFAHNGDRRFHAASTIKVPILIEAWRQIERATHLLDDLYLLRDEDRVPGSGVLGSLHTGLTLTFADLLYLMIAVSDNTATNLVIERVGLDAVNETMAALGMTGSELGRPMLGRLPDPGEPENWATPRDFGVALQAIVADTAANPESCARMRQSLAQQGEIRRISRFLPDDAGLQWGTKPGDLPGAINDVGYVTSDRGTLCLAVFSENLPDLDTAERTIGLIAREALALAGIVSYDAGRST